MKLQPVILSGGSGTRLWPLSRHDFPKQLLTLDGEHSMLQATALRFAPDADWQGVEIVAPLVVTNENYRFVSAEQLRQVSIQPKGLILEPCGRNTAPALTVAALSATAQGEDPLLVVMPADHVIAPLAPFRDAVRQGMPHAADGAFVTFGITPTHAHTGYGYIRAAAETAGDPPSLRAFVEKPDAATAARYLVNGDYFWNSGIFMMRASAWLAEIRDARPEIVAACEAAFAQSEIDHDFVRLGREQFAACPADSIDYAVMERLGQGREGRSKAVVIPLTAGWSDIGAWSALWEIGEKDEHGNLLKGDTHVVDTTDTLVFGADRLIACVGLKDVVVVDTADALLVANRGRMEQVKEVVAWLKRDRRPEAEIHRKVHRPWGWYDTIDEGARFQVKRIVVKPGASLSLQMHHHRAEHWVVVSGTARVTCGEDVFVLSENQSTYIPLGTKHRLENPGKVPLEIIEVQSGAYLGEDDIVRFDDNYGRR